MAISERWLSEEIRWNSNHPRAAPQFRCHDCRRWIAKTRTVTVLFPERHDSEPIVLCLSCLDKPTSKKAHAQWYPDCPVNWHDMYDHHDRAWGSRAGIAAVIDIWPRGRRGR